jgi:hypothetical protein
MKLTEVTKNNLSLQKNNLKSIFLNIFHNFLYLSITFDDIGV